MITRGLSYDQHTYDLWFPDMVQSKPHAITLAEIGLCFRSWRAGEEDHR
jgi:hypothetical protein